MTSFTRGFLDLLEEIRVDELNAMLPRLGGPARLLEIGAGSGWQAKLLTERGFSVDAIDVGNSNYRDVRVWPVLEYDGYRIPFADDSFDVVFSSNVMEHIPHVVEFQSEILRVLRPGGIAVHAMPSFTWRLLTTLAFYPWMCGELFRRITRGSHTASSPASSVGDSAAASPARRSLLSRLRGLLSAPRHGEIGSMLSEFWLFSKPRWLKIFSSYEFESIQAIPLRVAYSGYLVLGTTLSFEGRRQLSRVVGSSCVAYTMKKRRHAP
jgi:SAM-dependent methyltransferase